MGKQPAEFRAQQQILRDQNISSCTPKSSEKCCMSFLHSEVRTVVMQVNKQNVPERSVEALFTPCAVYYQLIKFALNALREFRCDASFLHVHGHNSDIGSSRIQFEVFFMITRQCVYTVSHSWPCPDCCPQALLWQFVPACMWSSGRSKAFAITGSRSIQIAPTQHRMFWNQNRCTHINPNSLSPPPWNNISTRHPHGIISWMLRNDCQHTHVCPNTWHGANILA